MGTTSSKPTARRAQSPPRSVGHAKIGARVQITGLPGRPELNGQEGVVVAMITAEDGTARMKVKLPSGEAVTLKMPVVNKKKRADSQTRPGEKVEGGDSVLSLAAEGWAFMREEGVTAALAEADVEAFLTVAEASLEGGDMSKAVAASVPPPSAAAAAAAGGKPKPDVAATSARGGVEESKGDNGDGSNSGGAARDGGSKLGKLSGKSKALKGTSEVAANRAAAEARKSAFGTEVGSHHAHHPSCFACLRGYPLNDAARWLMEPTRPRSCPIRLVPRVGVLGFFFFFFFFFFFLFLSLRSTSIHSANSQHTAGKSSRTAVRFYRN